MVAIVMADDLVLVSMPPVDLSLPRRLKGCLNRLRPARNKIDMIQAAGCNLGQLAAELRAQRVCHHRMRIGVFIKLCRYRGFHARVIMREINGEWPARRIKVPIPSLIIDINTFGSGDGHIHWVIRENMPIVPVGMLIIGKILTGKTHLHAWTRIPGNPLANSSGSFASGSTIETR